MPPAKGRRVNRKASNIDMSALPVRPLDLSRPAAEQIAADVKSAILNVTLTPGSMISENEIGQVFGASRTPVREAFALLRSEGLVVTYPSRGTYVSKLAEHQIRGAQFLREALEVAVIGRLCDTGLSEAARTSLETNLKQQADALADNDRATFHALDDQFHSLLAGATGYPRICTILQSEKTALDRLRCLSLGHQERMTELFEEHRGILDSIVNGYSGQALDRMRLHLRSILSTLTQLIADNRDYFEDDAD